MTNLSSDVSSVAISVQHVVIKTNASYEEFSAKFEKQLGKIDPAAFQKLAMSSPRAEDFKKFFEEGGNSDRLVLFTTYEHGGLLSTLFGIKQKGITYVVGNPFFAAQMTRHNLGAGLYAPLRVIVYANADGNAEVEYDLPSSLFGQFGNSDITSVAKTLDEKLSQAIEKSSP